MIAISVAVANTATLSVAHLWNLAPLGHLACPLIANLCLAQGAVHALFAV